MTSCAETGRKFVTGHRLEFTCLVASRDAVGESPLWHPEQHCLYWVDINSFRLNRFHPETHELQAWKFEEPVTALALTTRPECLLVALGGRLIVWDTVYGTETPFTAVETSWPALRLNDGAAGPDGTFWVGSMQNNVAADGSELRITQDLGSLYRVTPQKEVIVCDRGFGITNTIAWSPARDRFFCGCSRRSELYVYRYEERSGQVGERRLFANPADSGVPDGSAVNVAGMLWNCRHSGGCILGFSPEGEIIHRILCPTRNVTNCVFGGDDLRTLFITTAALGAPEGDVLAGHLFSLSMEVPGVPPYRFML